MNALQLKKIALSLSLSAALSAQAAGLGVMTSSSKLGEPLNAEIELLAVAPNELSSIQAALASEQFYQDQLLEKPNAYPFIKIEVASNPNGQPILKLSSSQPITEAFLDMLIQVDWPTGRLVKEYTLLLDPPGVNTSNVTEPISLPNTDTATTNATAATPKAPATAKAVPVSADNTAERSEKKEVVVKAGDNLHQLAEQLRPDSVTHTQMLAALYQANIHAFDGQNMNRLKVGKVLRMPSADRLAAMDQAQALAIVNAHLSAWQAYKNGLAGAVKTAAPNASTGNTAQSTAGKVAAPPTNTPASAPTAKDVLKLSAGETAKRGADNSSNQALEAKLSGLQEDLIAKDNAIKEEKSRTLALEKQLEDMKKLLALKNDAMAKLQANAANPTLNSETAATTTPPDAAQANDPAAQADANATQAETNTTQADANVEQPTAPPVAATLPPANPSTASAASASKDAQTTSETMPEAVPESHFTNFLTQRLTQMHPGVWMGLVVLPLLGVLWLWTRVRRKKQIHTFEEAIMTSPATEMQNHTVFGHTQATTGDTSFLTDFSQSAVGGMIDAHEVDPIAEAEVYMAYGRDAQAEEILKDAMLKDPRRHELKVKLLEIYQATNNAAAFDSLAETLHTQVEPNSALWSQVAAMGRQMNPQSALYREVATISSLDATGTPADNDTALRLNETPASNPAASAADEEMTFTMPEAMLGGNLQPKAISLPALDFDDANATTQSSLAPTSGEPTLAASDQVFDRLPELSFAMDAPTTPNVNRDTTAASDDNIRQNIGTVAAISSPEASSMVAHSEIAKSINMDQTFDLTLDDFSSDAAGSAVSSNHPVADDALIATELSQTNASAEALAMPETSVAMEAPTANDEVDTKLDLIKAYIDMEDAIGARELIEEVMAEGNPAQQALAASLLKKIV